MDFLTQVTLGGVIGHTIGNHVVGNQAVGNRAIHNGAAKKAASIPLGKKAVIAGALLGALPDADVLIHFGNDINNFVYHRSFSHSLFILLGLSVFLFYISTVFLKTHIKKYNISSTRLFLLISLPLVTHPILDSFTVYGTQLFWPFFTDLNGRSPESWSTLFIIDPLYSIPLLIALYLSLIHPLKVTASYFALGFSCCYLVFSLTAKQIINERVTTLKKENNISNNARFITTPTPFNTLLWRAVIMQDNHYQVAYISLFNMKKATLSAPIEHNEKTIMPMNKDALKKLKWFSHGFYRLDQNDKYIIATDLRMGAEDAYVFRFALEKTSEDTDGKTPPFKLKNDIDFSKLKAIYTHF